MQSCVYLHIGQDLSWIRSAAVSLSDVLSAPVMMALILLVASLYVLIEEVFEDVVNVFGDVVVGFVSKEVSSVGVDAVGLEVDGVFSRLDVRS